MPPAETRQYGHIKRPRPSLSCVVCRRRKVRCGREQPACHNCNRLQEACEYESEVRNQSTPEVNHRSVPSTVETGTSWSTPPIVDETWPELVGQEVSPTSLNRAGNLSWSVTTSDAFLSASSSSANKSDSSIQTTNIILSQNSPSRSSNSHLVARSQDLGAKSASVPWDTSNPSDSGRVGRMITPPLVNTPTRELGIDPSRKRLRTSSVPKPLQGSVDSQGEVQPALLNKGSRTESSADTGNFEKNDYNTGSPGYLSVRGGGQVRHVSNVFWGLVTGYESLCEVFLGEPINIPDNIPQPHIDSPGLANLLKTLPPKVVCDLLLQSFSISVHPILPLIHFPTLQKDYNNFWQWCRNSDISQPDNKLLGDPTFLCLLFSILYCGAITALPALWTTSSLHRLEQGSICKQLQSTYSASLNACQHLRYPTLSTLVSSLLFHGCSTPNVEPLDDLRYIASVVRIAQSMGLHCDSALFGLDPLTCELRHRVWWHIVWLDVQASVLHGSQTCCGSSEDLNNFRMVSSTRDEDLFSTNQRLPSKSQSPSIGATSISMLLAIGRFETVRFKHFLINNIDGSRILRQARLDECMSTAKSLQVKLDMLLANIPVQDISEMDFNSSRLINPSSTAYEKLYSDHESQSTIWSYWARTMITMLKSEAGILVQKPFLARADSETDNQQEIWNSIVQLCITYLRNFMQLIRVPAFAPYTWFCTNHLAPLHSVFLCLTYMQCNRKSKNKQIIRYFVDEVIDIFASSARLSGTGDEEFQNPAVSDVASSDKQIPLAWRVLITLRNKIDLHPGADQPLFNPTVPIRCETLPPEIALHAMSLSTSQPITDPLVRGSESAPSGLSGDQYPYAEPPVVRRHDEGEGDDNEVENEFNISGLAAWSSSLIHDPFESWNMAQDNVNDATNPPLEWNLDWPA